MGYFVALRQSRMRPIVTGLVPKGSYWPQRVFHYFGTKVPFGLSHGSDKLTAVRALPPGYPVNTSGVHPMSGYFTPLSVSVTMVVLVFTTSGIAGSIIHVPAEQPTIQAGINAAINGDAVVVAPGTYRECINFNGKSITVTSSGAATDTIIDGARIGPVVTFSSNETSTSVLSGFTIQRGNAINSPAGEGGGIAVESASPIIKNNIIRDNWGSNGGGGIGVGFGSPLIEGNIILNNTQSPLISGGIGGGGISVRGASAAQIVGNVIQNNTWPTAFGGGLSLDGAGSVLVKDNLFIGNTCADSGNAIAIANDASGTVIVQNVFTGNNSKNGSSVFWWNSPAALVNNTMTDGPTSNPGFSIVTATGLSASTVIANNVIAATNVGTIAFDCVFSGISNPLKFYKNDVFSSIGAAYGGLCTDQTGSNGNTSANPNFVSKTNLRVKGGSPAIDAGRNSAPSVPTRDIAGNPRIINGNELRTPIIDMGAYEFVPVVLSPKNLSFGLQAIGSTTMKTVTLANKQNKALTISSYSTPTGYSVSGCGTSVPAFGSCTLTVTFHTLTGGTFKGSLIVNDNAGDSPQAAALSGSAH
jgi:hypothetical protein